MLLKAVNRYRTSNNLNPHELLNKYLEKLKAKEQFDELTEENVYTYHRYERVEEPYTKKDGTHGQYQGVTRVDHKEPVKDKCQKILDTGNAYLKHRAYVDNVLSVFPEMKTTFLQNLALRPKDEVQSAHFFGKQLTPHCSIVNPVNNRYHFHLSDDTNHDSIFVDHAIGDIIDKYNIPNEDLWIQNDNASSQYENKYSFEVLNKLASEFNLRIIRTYGAAGHGKGAIDGMSSFAVKNVLRKDIVNHDVFFNKSEEAVDYLEIKRPHFSYTYLPSDDVVKSRIENNESMIIKECMKQHLMVFTKNEPILCKEYLCLCSLCLEFYA